ncbi:hypothetical protein KUCAC02_036702, partial [Chaenocephalus aceratus]
GYQIIGTESKRPQLLQAYVFCREPALTQKLCSSRESGQRQRNKESSLQPAEHSNSTIGQKIHEEPVQGLHLGDLGHSRPIGKRRGWTGDVKHEGMWRDTE